MKNLVLEMMMAHTQAAKELRAYYNKLSHADQHEKVAAECNIIYRDYHVAQADMYRKDAEACLERHGECMDKILVFSNSFI